MILNDIEILKAAGNPTMIFNYVETLEMASNPTTTWNNIETLRTLLICTRMGYDNN